MLSAIVGILVGSGQHVAAQDTEEGLSYDSRVLEEVVVTARKRAESAMSIPESISAFGSSRLERNGIDGLTDVGNLVPNMFMSVRADGFPNVSIRGLGAFGNTQGVGFYVDDVQVFSGISSHVGDIDRIEVLKGPQGILYGGSNIGGAVKFVSKRPVPEEIHGRAKTKIGTDDYYDAEFALNAPIAGSWAARIFGYTLADDSFLTNPGTPGTNTDPDAGKRSDMGGRIAIAGNVTDRLSLYANLRYSHLDAPNNFWVRELDPDFDYPLTLDATRNPRHKKDSLFGTLELTYDLDAFTVTSLSSYFDADSARTVDLDLSPAFILGSESLHNYETITQEVRLTSTDDSPFQWLAGVYYMEHERDELSNLIMPPDTASPFRNYDQGSEQQAAFVNLTYRFDAIEVAGGARVNRWESSRTNLDTGLSGEQSETDLLFRGSLSWYFDEDSSLIYGVVAQGLEPGGFNLTNFTGSGSLFGFGPEEATSYEIGYKAQLLNDSMQFTLAGFYIDYDDRQFELTVADPNEQGVVEGIINAGDSTQWGVEGELQWQFSRAWSVSGGVGYLDASWDDGLVSPVNNTDLSGERPPQTPEWSGTASLDYSNQLNADMRVFGRLQLQYKAEVSTNAQFIDEPGDDFSLWENPSYTVVDFSLGARWKSWEFVFLVENLLDEDYYVDSGEFPNFDPTISQGSVIAATPEQVRRYSLSMEFSF